MMIDSAAVLLELIKTGLALLLLAAGWFVGKRILNAWDLRKKRQELDIAAAEAFQSLYGELKQVARLWRSARAPKDRSLIVPADLRWTMLARATAAESRYEALVIKLATERELSADEIRTLGLFRQACQQVRESIQRDAVVPSSGFGREYLLFNELAAEVTCLIGSNRAPGVLDAASAKRNLEGIALVRSGDWAGAVAEYKVKQREDGLVTAEAEAD